MRALTRTVLAADAARSWADSYSSKGDDYRLADGRKAKDVYLKLEELGPTPDPSEVDAVIGNDLWTKVPECDVCGGDYDAVIEFVTTFDDNATFVCFDCLQVAASIAYK